MGMMDWIAIGSACGLAGVVGLGFVVWERYENRRLLRERPRIPRPAARVLVPRRGGRHAA
jgi:hypothetical protein